jgi:hypothetical protein
VLFGHGQRGHPVRPFAFEPQRLSARGQQLEIRGLLKQRVRSGRGIGDQVLTVIENQQASAVLHVAHQGCIQLVSGGRAVDGRRDRLQN